MSFTAIRLDAGTKEYVNANVVDETNQVTTLVGTSPTFEVKVVDNGGADAPGTTKQSGACLVTDMVLQALIDTTTGGGWAIGHYTIEFSWTIGSEVPVEGPFDLWLI
jgi:hypothetical protein